MELTNFSQTPGRQAAVNGLAVVGFVALIVIGIMLAVYAARFVPSAVSRVASASVYFSSLFSPAPQGQLEVIPGDSIPFGSASSTDATTTASTNTSTSTPATHPATPAAGPRTTTVYPVGGASGYTGTLTGKPDLTVKVTAVGYLKDGTDTTSFVASTTVPDGKNGAVQFTVTNAGTNLTGAWTFDANIPTSPTYVFHSPAQQSLNPGEHIDYVLGFDRARSGDSREITITADAGDLLSESNETNNSDSGTVTIQ